jgi:hypothetical protein
MGRQLEAKRNIHRLIIEPKNFRLSWLILLNLGLVSVIVRSTVAGEQLKH